MPITFDLIGRAHLKIKILKGPSFAEDRDKIKTLRGKKPHYEVDKVTGIDTFQYWEIPLEELSSLCSHFKEAEIITQSEAAEKVLKRFYNLMLPADQLPPIDRVVNWRITPKSYQEEYIRTSDERQRLILAHDPGTGKTGAALMRAHLLGFKKILVVCPKSVMVNWRTEVHKFLGMPSLIYHCTKPQREKLRANFGEFQVVITSYSMMSEIDFKAEQIIFDEAHMMAHKNTKTAKTAKTLVNKNRTSGIQLLSGTPILHKPADLWFLVHLLYPEVAGDYWAWKSRYEEVIKSITKTIVVKDASGKPRYNEFGRPIDI